LANDKVTSHVASETAYRHTRSPPVPFNVGCSFCRRRPMMQTLVALTCVGSRQRVSSICFWPLWSLATSATSGTRARRTNRMSPCVAAAMYRSRSHLRPMVERWGSTSLRRVQRHDRGGRGVPSDRRLNTSLQHHSRMAASGITCSIGLRRSLASSTTPTHPSGQWHLIVSLR
jgi:hypothetical protein